MFARKEWHSYVAPVFSSMSHSGMIASARAGLAARQGCARFGAALTADEDVFAETVFGNGLSQTTACVVADRAVLTLVEMVVEAVIPSECDCLAALQ